jgi:dimethylhistidine N-methyltransferase
MPDVVAIEATDAPPGSALSYFADCQPSQEDFLAAVNRGFSQSQKNVPPMFFYDERGSALFNAICETEEYYVTRTEVALLDRIGPQIREITPRGMTVVEYGCGSNLKIRALLNALTDAAEYVAIDISREHLEAAADEIAEEYPKLKVGAICADFNTDMVFPEGTGRPRLGFFPGSTIGNQTPARAQRLLSMMRRQLEDDGALLIGVDLKKDEARLNAAYNDAEGQTAAFNLNLLHRMNRELDAGIDVDAFAHKAFFNADESRIEMHLVSLKGQTVEIGGRHFDFAEGETIHTESSYKYEIDAFAAIAREAGFATAQVWTDSGGLFSIHYLKAA